MPESTAHAGTKQQDAEASGHSVEATRLQRTDTCQQSVSQWRKSSAAYLARDSEKSHERACLRGQDRNGPLVGGGGQQ